MGKTNQGLDITTHRCLISSDSLLIATRLQQAPVLLIADDAKHAKRLLNEIIFFAPQLRIAIFPGYEVLAYEQVSITSEIIANRLKILHLMLLNKLDIVIVSANNLHYKLPPKSYILGRIFNFKLGDKISLATFKSQLVSSDYSLLTQVFEAGDFAIRGSIIDVIPMGYKHLIRIELFDDEIETIAKLDAKTHQLIEKLDHFELIPRYEFAIDALSLKNFSKKFIEKFPKMIDSKFIKDLANNITPPGLEALLPLFFEQPSTIFDYIDSSWQIITYSDLSDFLAQNWQEFINRYAASKLHDTPPIPVDELFIPQSTIIAKIGAWQTHVIELVSEEHNSPLNLNNKFGVISQLANLSSNKQEAFAKLKELRENFKGKILIIDESIGRIEIIYEQLLINKIPAQIISRLNLASDNNQIYLLKGYLTNGFISNDIAYLTESDIFSHQLPKASTVQIPTHNNDLLIQDLNAISIGDLVIHANHGIGKYLGLITQEIAGISYEMLELEYQNESKLFVPIYNMHLISRYNSLNDTHPEISKLGSNKWKNAREKCEKRAYDTAAQLLEIYAKRKIHDGIKYQMPSEYLDFCANFGYEPTTDQETCFQAVIDDMTAATTMDRLICGDVGFGKTEVAIRAAFIAAMNGFQVVLLTPTTLLTEQHFANFRERFSGFPVEIAEISRFKSSSEIKKILVMLKEGKIDIIIGTHRLIQKDVEFARLGLVIIDEEHKFGVKQKERLKEMRINTDFLALTATPIPRTLSMALDGIRDFSIIATPPKKRLAINTQICGDDDNLITLAIMREVKRGGQVYFLYNNVANIDNMAKRLNKLFPELRIAIAHGQMNESLLEQTIHDFVLQRYHILLCSTIIESGIDIPNANTIIIYAANNFGLASLYQIRGRVGRSYHQAYCYLITPEQISNDAKKRLDALKDTMELGSGFNLALHDLEIRGAGEILGDNQSGDIKEVGLSLYTKILGKAIRQLKKHQFVQDQSSTYPTTIDTNDIFTEVNLYTTCIITEEYCHGTDERLIFYKRLSNAATADEVDSIYQELIDKYGLPPLPVKYLIASHHLRIKATSLGIKGCDIDSKQVRLIFAENPNINPETIITALQQLKTCRFDGVNKFTWLNDIGDNIDTRISKAHYLLDWFLT